MDGRSNSNSAVERRTIEIGRQIFSSARAIPQTQSPLDRWLMNIGIRDDALKTQLFRFVDVLATLTTPAEVDRHLQEYLGSSAALLKPWQRRAARMIPRHGPAAWALARFAKAATRRMAGQFIAASDLPGAIDAVQTLRRDRMAFTIDLLGEAVLSESEADRYQQRYLDLIAGLSDAADRWAADERLDSTDVGPLPRVNLSVKLSSLFSQFDPIDPNHTSEKVRSRLRPILHSARQRGAFVHIDMEQYAFKDMTLRIVRDVLMEPEFRDWSDVGVVIQAYLRDSENDLRALAEWIDKRGTPMWIRLVKGAYWDSETLLARQRSWPIPVFQQKAESDANFETLTDFLIDNHTRLRPAIASHNIRSLAHAIARAEVSGLPIEACEFQMLFGMADPIKAALVQMGRRVRVYTPFGELLPGMAYLVRRLLENTSNESFLRASFSDGVSEEKLLMNPLSFLHPAMPEKIVDEFRNEPATDFNRAEARQSMIDALAAIRPYLGATVRPLIDGREVDGGPMIESVNPSQTGEVSGRAIGATIDQAKAAVESAKKSFDGWRTTSPERRAELLRSLGAVLRRRRFELASWEVLETAKPWREADGDVIEAIDFCEFYAREMIRLSRGESSDLPGETNRIVYEARGVTVVIAPWNFPLAILCGMTTAALVTGNTVVMKPAEQSVVVGAKFMEAIIEAGFPSGVVQFLPGIGEEVGPVLVNHPDVATIVFTGSRAVGLAIQKSAATVGQTQNHLKRVITEMGGKNAIVVDDDADVDEAVAGIVASAFGYAGQKCSACSRVIVLDSIYDALVERLIAACASLQIGPADDPSTTVPPVIDEPARARIEQAIARGKTEATPAFAGGLGSLAGTGCYVAPHIFVGVAPESSLAQEEIFGPVLSVLRALDLDDALRIANGTKYALTGGIYSRSPANIARVSEQFRVGNLYINRKITGALVGRQPFGGFKLSGIGSQAGGRNYLQQFLIPRTITENTTRRGFAPADE